MSQHQIFAFVYITHQEETRKLWRATRVYDYHYSVNLYVQYSNASSTLFADWYKYIVQCHKNNTNTCCQIVNYLCNSITLVMAKISAMYKYVCKTKEHHILITGIIIIHKQSARWDPVWIFHAGSFFQTIITGYYMCITTKTLRWLK